MTDARARRPLLDVVDLRTHFFTDAGVLPSVDGVSFTIDRGETLGIVGESGCGKSVTAMSILRLIPQPPGRIVGGQVLFEGVDLTTLPEPELRKVRGNDISVIFQEPMTSLNPVYTIGDQIMEAILLHQQVEEDTARAIALDMLERVGIPAAATRIDEYPHQMSGGMKQRVMIAMALSCKPKLLIADEPTTALDVTIQAQILELLKELQAAEGMGIMLITHDLGVVAETCDRVAVLYAGQVAETGATADIFDRPTHPYTLGLMQSLPDRAPPGGRLFTIDGMVPSPLDFPTGCRFRTRCPRASGTCAVPPPLHDLGGGHRVWCHHPLSADEPGELVDRNEAVEDDGTSPTWMEPPRGGGQP
ncbi:MAG: ABC transporter ATP-binding protein [Alphaproteobacteria bacterium]|nr:ABC transporter ATP-binding protein [Alphaproteobacteria bacterium]